MNDLPHNVLVIGSGAAGLTAALALAETKRVLVLAKGGLSEGATAWAQGGIAAVLEAGDTFENHVRDTMVAGAGLNDRDVVEYVIGQAPASIDRLCDRGRDHARGRPRGRLRAAHRHGLSRAGFALAPKESSAAPGPRREPAALPTRAA